MMSGRIKSYSTQVTNSVLFPNYIMYSDYSNPLIDLIIDESLVKRFSTPFFQKLISEISQNSRINKTSIEIENTILTCNQVVELFGNTHVSWNKLIVSHSFFDCKDLYSNPERLFLINTNSVVPNDSNMIHLINLSPVSYQIMSVLSLIMSQFSYTKYGMIYSDETKYFKNIAENLVFKMSVNSQLYNLKYFSSLKYLNFTELIVSNVKSKCNIYQIIF